MSNSGYKLRRAFERVDEQGIVDPPLASALKKVEGE